MSGNDTHADTAALVQRVVDGLSHPELFSGRRALAAVEELVAERNRLRESLAHIKRDYEDVFGQLLRSHGEVARERARADQAERERDEARRELWSERGVMLDLQARADQAEAALVLWQQTSPVHRPECATFSEKGCNCGLNKARDATSAALSAGSGGRAAEEGEGR